VTPHQPSNSRGALIALIGVGLVAIVGYVYWLHLGAKLVAAPPVAKVEPVNAPVPMVADTTTQSPAADPQPAVSTDAAEETQYPQLTPGSDPHDPVIGCYMWFSMKNVHIYPGGAMTDGEFPGIWKRTGPAHYEFSWPPMVVTVKMSEDLDSMQLSNQYGYSWSGARTNTNIAMGFPIEGTWHWSNAWDVAVGHEDNGNLWWKSGPWSGTWRGNDTRNYTMQWPAPVDSVQMTDRDHLVGANQYGVTVSGYRNEKCR
jgi:hypothetical protein